MNTNADLTAGLQANRVMEIMTPDGTVYAKAGEIVKHDDGAVSQEITIQGDNLIGRVIREAQEMFIPENMIGETGDAEITFRNAVAVIVQEHAEDVNQDIVNELRAETAQTDFARRFPTPEALWNRGAELKARYEGRTLNPAELDAARAQAAQVYAEAAARTAEAEAAETEDAARGLIAATADRNARRDAAEKAARRAADAAGYARQAAAEATDAAREAGRLALMIRPDANPAEVQDVAQAAQAAATAAARSAGLARANAELAADRAAEAVAVAEDAAQDAQDAEIRFHAGQAVTVEKYDARGLSYHVSGVVVRDTPMDEEDVFILIGTAEDWFNHAAVTAF